MGTGRYPALDFPVCTSHGAGSVCDSDPEAEDAECHAKASAVLRAIAMARAVEATARGEADDDADEAEENEP